MAGADEITVAFDFLDPASGKALVKGEERIARDGADLVKHTTYRSPAGADAQVEEARYGADSLRLDHYHFEDKLTGELADVRVKGGMAAVQYRADRDAALKTGEIAWGPETMSGKALPELILHDWAKLSAGGTVAFDLYVPFRLETIGFHAVRKDVAKSGLTTILVEPSNWLIRKLAPSIEFVFDAAKTPPRLVHYKGPSVVDIAGEKNRAVEIDFR